MGRSPARHRVDASTRRMAAARLAARFEPRIFFTDEQAQRALVFLRPVVIDLCEAFAQARACRDLIRMAVGGRRRAWWIDAQEQAIARFDRALDDVESAGAEVVCCESGRLAFPTAADRGPARLVWSLREGAWSRAVIGSDGIECPRPRRRPMTGGQ